MNKTFGWQTLGKKLVYKNPFMRMVEYDVVRPNGTRAPYYVLDRGAPFAIIIPLSKTGKTYLVGQYRYASNFYSWEFPMGAVAGLTPLKMAKQELREETGLTAKKWQKIGQFYVANGHTNQEAFVFVACDLKQGEPEPEENEFLEIKKMPLERVGEWIRKGKIRDGPTITAYHFLEFLDKGCKSWHYKSCPAKRDKNLGRFFLYKFM